MLLVLSADFFQALLFTKKNLSGTLSMCQIVWIQIRTKILSSKEKIKFINILVNLNSFLYLKLGPDEMRQNKPFHQGLHSLPS